MEGLRKEVLLDSIEVSRESIGIFERIIKSMPELEEIAQELAEAEQKNIKQAIKELTDEQD